MTNLERMRSLPMKEFLEEIDRLISYPFYRYLDREAYLNSENEDLTSFLKTKGVCRVKPSEMELISVLGDDASESEREMYTLTHMKTMPVLERTGGISPHIVAADIQNGRIISVPSFLVEESDDDG